jgi:hypothetical protein
VAIAVGLAIVVVAQRSGRLAAPPLFDGVVVTDPYRWLSPPPGQLGGARGVTGTETVSGESPVVAIATPEEPPQAQIFAPPGALVLPAGTTSLRLAISPISPTGSPPNGAIAGNEYKITVVNQDGDLAVGRAGGNVTVVLRGPPSANDATIERFADGSWQKVQTESSGLPATFLAVVTDFGDFAIVVPTASAPTTSTAAVGPSQYSALSPGATTPAVTRGGGDSGSDSVSTPLPSVVELVIVALAAIGAGLLIAAFRRRRRKV